MKKALFIESPTRSGSILVHRRNKARIMLFRPGTPLLTTAALIDLALSLEPQK